MNQLGNEPLMQMNFRIERENKEKLEKLARLERRKLSDYVRLVLQDYIKEQERKGTI